MKRRKAVSHFVRMNVRFIFLVRFESFDEGIKGFLVVFGDIKFNARSIQSESVCKGRANDLRDGFCEIHHVLEHQFNVRRKVLFKACEKGSVWHFGESAEISSVP